MAKKTVKAIVKLQVPAGKATPAPPVGPALGPHGVQAAQFCQQFNERTKKQEPGVLIPVVITIYTDKSFTFITKTPPAAVLIKKALGLEKGSGEPNKTKVGALTKDKLRAIAEQKMPDLTAKDVEAAMKIIAGHGPQHGRHGGGLIQWRMERNTAGAWRSSTRRNPIPWRKRWSW